MGLQWFPCYVNDLLGSMRWKCMTAAERGAYWQLICWQMQAEDGHLPEPLSALSALADLNLSEHPGVADAFPLDETGRRANRRALIEWVKAQGLSEKRREIGSAGGRASAAARAQAIGQPIGEAIGKQLVNTTTTTATATKTTTPTQTQKRASKPAPLYRWDDLASVYPADKLVPDKRAKAWWRKHVKDGDDLLVGEILAGAKVWADSRQYQDGFGFGILRFLDEQIWKRLPAADRAPAPRQADESFMRGMI